MPELLLALDVGTTSARALVGTADGQVLGSARVPIVSHFPGPGLVEQDAEEVWTLTRRVIALALEKAGRDLADIAAIGVTTQRASIVLWDAATIQPVAPMVVWSDLRGLPRTVSLKAEGFTVWPQTPAAKLEAVMAGRDPAGLAWGTLDSFIVAKLSGGAAHVTDVSNAWVSGYMDFQRFPAWHAGLMAAQRLPESLFPRVVESWGPIAEASGPGGGIPITALLADQQAGMFAHGWPGRGAWKATYGTSAVLMVGMGPEPTSPHPTLPVMALAAGEGEMLFCFEGMVITAGAFIDWLCGLGLFASPADLQAAAESVTGSGGAAMRPSLQGLGAPHGRFDLPAMIDGLRPGVGRGELARAALEGLAFRMREIAATVTEAGIAAAPALPADGGATANGLLMQIQADVLQRPVRRHAVRDATAYGAMLAAAMGAGLVGRDDLAGLARYDAVFEPAISADEAEARYAAWAGAVLP
jgi:glycerol kinase